MIVQFSDHSSLALALEDLLRVGVPEQRISAYFEDLQAGERDLSEHQSFLQQLRAWVVNSSHGDPGGQGRVARSPSLPIFKEYGGAINIKCPQLEDEIIQSVLRYNGHLVG